MSKNIKIAVRCRPLIGKTEQLEGIACNLVCSPEHKQVTADEKVYSFDFVFNAGATQEDIFLTSVNPLVESFLKGENVAVMAYGQTGSGKTFTMGTEPRHERSSPTPDDIGIAPRVLRHIFANIDRVTDPDICIEIKVSFLEIYNEEVYDILRPTRSRVQIRQQDINVVKLTDLSEFVVHSYDDGIKYLHEGAGIRTTGATATSAHSSRSHAIFYIFLSRTSMSELQEGPNAIHFFWLTLLGQSTSAWSTVSRRSSCSFFSSMVVTVDLDLQLFNRLFALSGVNINKSLLALSKVIRALSQDKVKYHAPYRDSTLTRLLQGCLQENCNTLVIACISPVEDNMAETNNTLQFATCAQNVKRKDPYYWSAKKRTPQWFSTPKVNAHSTPLGGIDHSCTPSASETIITAPVNQRLDFSLSVVEERAEETTFKKPKPRQDCQPAANSFTPYANMICSRLEKCIDKLVDTKPMPAIGLDTTACQRLVERITYRTLEVLKESTNFKVPEKSFRESLTSTTKPECNVTVIKQHQVDASISSRRRESSLSMPFRTNSWTADSNSNVENSILLSCNRNQSQHSDAILSLLNNGTVQQLQLLPCIGQKSAIIIHNWVSKDGPLKKISELCAIPGLPKGFARKFASSNAIIMQEEIS